MRGRKPTRIQKVLMSMHGLNTANWLIMRDEKDCITIMHRNTGTIRKIPKIKGLK